jgi:hypothetical protein
MPSYSVSNTTANDVAYVRVYTPDEYSNRFVKKNNSYHAVFDVDPGTINLYSDHADEIVFLVQMLNNSEAAAGIARHSKKQGMTDQEWQQTSVGVSLDLRDNKVTARIY